ncbi:hypothetical protein CHS0354_004671 [Potamilus streckersoni]|uniref:Uncharacterized protein n=1 Tax=Potamilus streckersoni TaxID=2493646 RepID=A0AAE0TBB5_9BIVA|nr:hypothetical protein CHS0354_004671 [Potamilus streckersoni]
MFQLMQVRNMRNGSCWKNSQKLIVNGEVIPDLSIKDGCKGEKTAIAEWPSVYITDIAAFLNRSTPKGMVHRLMKEFKEVESATDEKEILTKKRSFVPLSKNQYQDVQDSGLVRSQMHSLLRNEVPNCFFSLLMEKTRHKTEYDLSWFWSKFNVPELMITSAASEENNMLVADMQSQHKTARVIPLKAVDLNELVLKSAKATGSKPVGQCRSRHLRKPIYLCGVCTLECVNE